MRIAAWLLVTSLGAVGAARATAVDIIASQETLILRLEITPASADFDSEALAELIFSGAAASAKVRLADEACNIAVELSGDSRGQDMAFIQRKEIEAFGYRRQWAAEVDALLAPLRGNAEIKVSLVFPNSAEKARLKSLKRWPSAGTTTAEEMKKLNGYRRRLTDALLAVAWLRERQQIPTEAADYCADVELLLALEDEAALEFVEACYWHADG